MQLSLSFLLCNLVYLGRGITSSFFHLEHVDRRMTSSHLWKLTGVVDKISCSVSCTKDPRCRTLQFSDIQLTCQGYPEPISYYEKIAQSYENKTGFKIFSTNGSKLENASLPLESFNFFKHACNDSGSCKFPNAICHHGSCLCPIGVYYSHRDKQCVRRCPRFGEGMTIYKGIGILEHNFDKVVMVSVEECLEKCSKADFGCLSCEYSTAKFVPVCFLSKHGFLDVDTKYQNYNSQGWILAQRNCL